MDLKQQVQARLRTSLSEIGLFSSEQMTKIENDLLSKNKILKALTSGAHNFDDDSSFWDFKTRFFDFVERFKKEGITSEKYLKAIIKEPQLLCHKVNNLENKVIETVELFKEERLTAEEYLQACLRRPQLLLRSQKLFKNNLKDLCREFRKQKLTLEVALQSALREPSLFYVPAKKMGDTLKELVRRFKKDGLTLGPCLKTALQQPQYFYLPPESVENNIRTVVEAEGLPIKDYLKALFKQPSLGTYSATTVIEHLQAIKASEELGIISFDSFSPKTKFSKGLSSRNAFLLSTPHILVSSSENLLMRSFAAVIVGPKTHRVFRKGKKELEDALVSNLNGGDRSKTIKALPSPADRNAVPSNERIHNMLLRAMIRSRLISGYTLN